MRQTDKDEVLRMLSDAKAAIDFVTQVYQPSLEHAIIVLDLEEELDSVCVAVSLLSVNTEREVYPDNLKAALGCAFAAIIDGDCDALSSLLIHGNVKRIIFGKHKVGESRFFTAKRDRIDIYDEWSTIGECASALKCKAWLDNGIALLRLDIENHQRSADAADLDKKIKDVASQIALLQNEFKDITERVRAGVIDSYSGRKACEPIYTQISILNKVYQNLREEYDKAFAAAERYLMQIDRFYRDVQDIERFIKSSRDAAHLYCRIYERINFANHTVSPEVKTIFSDTDI